ncbi:hypothetical protein [Xanthomonas phage DES1]|nr:hypothetical protein [Xanthomonas phage DES1]
MALPTPTPTGQVAIPNAGFESGNVSWTVSGSAAIVNESPIAGGWSAKAQGAGEASDGSVRHNQFFPVIPGQGIALNAIGKMTEGTPGTSIQLFLQWYDSNQSVISTSNGSLVNRQQVGDKNSTVSANGVAPSNAAYVRPLGAMNVSRGTTNNIIFLDSFSWDYAFGAAFVLTAPANQTYEANEQIPYRLTSSLNGQVGITSVSYYYQTQNSSTDEYENETLVATVTDAPYSFNAPALSIGSYAAYARVNLSNGLQVVSNIRLFDVGAATPPETREFKASNSYTYLIGENIADLSSGVPATAIVTGAEILLTYSLEIISRTKDLGIEDPLQANPFTAFDILQGASVEATLLNKQGQTYSILGGAQSANVLINRNDFTLIESAVSEGKSYKHYVGPSATTSVGGENSLFNLGSTDASTFLTNAIGIRFIPTIAAKPAYADSGDAVVRFKLDNWKIRVYFDAGSVEYYFASPDKTQVIKGQLAAANIDDGSLKTGDASGAMQLLADLEVVTGTQSWIGDDWTIHSFYPPTSANQIGEVAQRTDPVQSLGMKYNGLPSQDAIFYNRSRYEFITANFYGDESLDATYGVTGLSRAFCYNGEFFYKIQTQPELAKDMPRHVAFHHTHLALGFQEGRVDISVVGQPYNFDGALGASSWAIGDSVVGLTRLPGAMLGVFGSKSISGISGTTVDNFATQTISPNIGAIEYTVADMGFPVYANAYGIYTLSQTNQYGDYLGNPLSQAISPWLRPRLVRKFASAKEVVVAWPVRSKNQYRLGFSDGYVLSMTMNYGTQSTPTFSKQKYFITEPDEDPVIENYTLLEYPAIYPIAVSSELDDSGEERIHIAHYWAMS